ncbi:MAG: exodeoxyribonuclease VII small subunit [Clostridia bacterium]|nr:exodeoxyribonuclease VII small subunit [Clostridia bacterium]
MDYEKKIEKLEQIVKKLEDGKISLDESVALFEEGVAITKDCFSALNEYKGKISVVQGEIDKLFKDEE